MPEVDLQEAQVRLPELIDEAARGEDVIITRDDGATFSLTQIVQAQPPPQAEQDWSKFIDIIAKHVKEEKCILFLGAGVHYEPPADSGYVYPKERRPLLGGELVKDLVEHCSYREVYPHDQTPDLQRVALYFEKEMGRDQLVNRIRAAVDTDGVSDKEPSSALKALARLPFPLVITTNYDHLFENSLRAPGIDKRPNVSVYNKDAFAVTKDYEHSIQRPFVYKIHGDIEEENSIVITDEDYIHFILRMSSKDPFNPIPDTFRFFFKKWSTLFIGYSLLDYNLRLLFKTLRWGVDQNALTFPTTYSVDPYPDHLIWTVWENEQHYVKFIRQGVWEFVPELYKRVTGDDMRNL